MTKKKERQDDKLPLDMDDKRKLKTIDGKATLKESTPKEVQAAADLFFSKKADLACAKSNMDKAAEEILCVMGKNKMAQATVFDNEGYKKRIVIRVGAEKLKVEKAIE